MSEKQNLTLSQLYNTSHRNKIHHIIIFTFFEWDFGIKENNNSTKAKITSKALGCPSSLTSRPYRWRAAAAAPPKAGLALFVADGKSPNRPIRKKDEPPIKLLDDPKIPTARRSP
jgi:hypothetical protein